MVSIFYTRPKTREWFEFIIDDQFGIMIRTHEKFKRPTTKKWGDDCAHV
jgi:hypothetical protein